MTEPEREVDPRPDGRASLARALSDGFLGLVDSGIPEAIRRGDPEELRKVRTIMGFVLMMLILSIESTLYFHHALPLEGATRIDLSVFVGLGLTLAIPTALRRGVSIAAAGNLVLGASFVVIVTVMTLLGGIEAPILHWCALAPMLAVFMGARRSAWGWAALSIVTLLAMGTATALGYEFDNYMARSQVQGFDLWAQRSVELLSWLGILLTVALVYERHKDQQTRELADKNAALIHEIGQRERAEEKTRYLAYYDELTTLPNRQLFKDQLARAMEHASREQRLIALLFLDLDGFKEVNDSHGHDYGDTLLQGVARRLLHCVRAVDSVSRAVEDDDDHDEEEVELVSRLGGDEFTILLDGLRDFNEAALVARRVLDSLALPFDLDGHEVFISASIGIALYPGGAAQTLDELLRNADLAMYHAKEMGRNNFQFFENTMNEVMVERATVAHDLRFALVNGELDLDYQPILDAKTRRVVGTEALLRWRHPERGLVPPDEFIQIAEETGLIVKIGEWVLGQACRQFAIWKQIGIAPRRISVNVSGIQFRTQRFPDVVVAALAEAGLEPRHLELEITENAMMIDEAEAGRSLRELSELGVRIAFDDFGTGYSSLSYLQRFPVDVLKIDRSFVGEIESDLEAQAIATAIIAMAHRLGLGVVGEGVETEAQAKFLEEQGCDALQGYLFSRPMSEGAATAHLGRHHAMNEDFDPGA